MTSEIYYMRKQCTGVYTGNPLFSDKYELSSGSCAENEILNVDISGSQTEPGEGQRIVSNVIIRSGTMETTENYNISCVPGKITVIKLF